MKRLHLTVQKRDALGKKVKKLRREGLLPANIYGKGVTSLAVQVAQKDFDAVFKETGETGLLDVKVNGEIRPVLIHNVQIHPVTRAPLHADFYQVNLKEKVKTMVPLVIVGEPKAVTDKLGLLLQPLSEVEVEALPEDLPENIEVDVVHLAQVGDQITTQDLKALKGVTVLTDPGQVVAKIDELVSKEAQEQAATEAAAAEAAKVASDATKAEATVAAPIAEDAKAPAEGETKTPESEKPVEPTKEEKKPEEKPQ